MCRRACYLVRAGVLVVPLPWLQRRGRRDACLVRRHGIQSVCRCGMQIIKVSTAREQVAVMWSQWGDELPKVAWIAGVGFEPVTYR